MIAPVCILRRTSTSTRPFSNIFQPRYTHTILYLLISIADEKGGMLNSRRQAIAGERRSRNGSLDLRTQCSRQTPRSQSGEECNSRQTDAEIERQRPQYQDEGVDGTKRMDSRRIEGSGFETKQQTEVPRGPDQSNWRKTAQVDRKW